MKTVLALALFAAACGTTTKPNDQPLPSWGVPISGGNVLALSPMAITRWLPIRIAIA